MKNGLTEANGREMQYYPFDPVSSDRFFDPVNAYSQPVLINAVRSIDNGEIVSPDPPAAAVNIFILPGASK